MKTLIRCAYVALVGLVVFMGALCIARGVSLHAQQADAPRQQESAPAQALRPAPDSPELTL